MPFANLERVKQHVIADKESNHFQLLAMGWEEDRFVFQVLFHFQIINGKIWLQRNQTDVLIADELMEAGVLGEDIVLGFQPAYVRPHTGFSAVNEE